MGRIAFVTWSGAPAATADDELAATALRELGVHVTAVPWTDRSVTWSDFDAVVLRSCWDYHVRFGRFRRWIDRLDGEGVALWNPPPLVRWNWSKSYLRDLESSGVAVVPTRWVSAGEPVSLGGLLDEEGWEAAVVKPAVSASARGTWRTGQDDRQADQARFLRQAARGDLMVQPFLPEIVSGGEWSFVYVDGDCTHAVRKLPAPGDFRVQEEFGGRIRAESPPAPLRAQADAVVATLPPGWLYARVDGIDARGRLLLLELELIEPSLYLRHSPAAATRLATALLTRL